jgi:hypothetical protein
MSKHRPLPIDNGGTGLNKSKDFTLPLSIGLAASILFTTAANVNNTLKVNKLTNEALMEQATRKDHDLRLLKISLVNTAENADNKVAIDCLEIRIDNLVDAIEKQKEKLAKQAKQIKELIRVAPSTYSLK